MSGVVEYLFISDWIKYDQSFDTKTYEFLISFTKGMKNVFKVDTSFIYQDGNSIETVPKIWNELNALIIEEGDMQAYIGKIPMGKPGTLKNEFKYVMKIYKVHEDTARTQELKIQLKRINLGDPCYASVFEPKCPRHLTCKRNRPNMAECECEPNKIGLLCDQTNHCNEEKVKMNLLKI